MALSSSLLSVCVALSLISTAQISKTDAESFFNTRTSEAIYISVYQNFTSKDGVGYSANNEELIKHESDIRLVFNANSVLIQSSNKYNQTFSSLIPYDKIKLLQTKYQNIGEGAKFYKITLIN